MSNPATRSYHERNESGNQSILSSQATWMAHWGQTRREGSFAQKNLIVSHKTMEVISPYVTKQQLPNLSRLDRITDASKELMRVPTTGPANVPDESMAIVSHSLREERPVNNQPFPMFGQSNNRGKSVLAIKDDHFHGRAVESQSNKQSHPDAYRMDPLKRGMISLSSTSRYETQSREHLDKGGRTQDLVTKDSLHVSDSFKDGVFASTFRNPFGKSAGRLDQANNSSSLFTSRGNLLNMSPTKLDQDQCDYNSSSGVFVHQQHNDHLPSKNELAFFHVDNEYPTNRKDGLASRFFRSHNSTFNVAEAECSTQPTNSFIDMETMRIRTTIDSVTGLKFHRTTEKLFFTEKKTDLKEGKIIRESTVSTAQLKGSVGTFTEVLRLSQDVGFKGHHQGVKLQPLWNSTDSEEKEIAAELENESSENTDTMVMATLQEDHPCGDEVLPMNKKYTCFPKLLASRAAEEFPSGEGSGRENAVLQSSGRNYLVLPSAASSSSDDKELSMSKTQSMDMAHLLRDSNGQMATKLKSRSTHNEPDPSTRWMKRLKISGSESWLGCGTKSLKMDEATSSPDKFNPFSRNTLKRTMSGSEPLVSNKSSDNKHISMNKFMRNSREELISCPWIRRWCRHDPVARNKSEGSEAAAFVPCEPQSLNTFLEELQTKRRFPSIAAMALMGKGMNAIRPCEIKKRDTFTYWNTN
ncbi:hypothetical protein SAY87_020900 [Trapa incisa]|uniref:F-box protein n=1 Tax=Trapa incisa TaxID=236973 RepID=A0AAN7PNK2_9MYRT|nr:hypothetical protein SAY87_020900 [Trapa incisa]